MRFPFFPYFLAMGLLGSASADTNCTSADGALVYRDRHYMGGPPPPPGFEIGRTEWTFLGKTMLREIRCTAGEHPPDLPREDGVRASCSRDDEVKDDDLVVGFDPSAEITLYESPPTEPWHRVRKYVTRAFMARPSGKPLPSGLPRHEDFAICADRRIFAP